MGAPKGNRNSAKHPLPPKDVLSAYVRLMQCGWITISQASRELRMGYNATKALLPPNPAPLETDVDTRIRWQLSKATLTTKKGPAMSNRRQAEQAKRDKLRAELESIR